MSMPPREDPRIRQAELALQEAQRLLVDPRVETLRELGDRLACIARMLEQLRDGVQQGLSAPAAAHADQIRCLSRRVDSVAALLASAGVFYAGWIRLVAARAGQDGRPIDLAELAARKRVFLEG
jgi:hypothetical protein